MKGAARGLLLLLGGALALGLAERLLRQVMAEETVVSRLLAPGGLTHPTSLVAAVAFFAFRLLVVGCLPGLVLGRLARLMFLYWAPQIRSRAAPKLPAGRPHHANPLDDPAELGHFGQREGP